MNIFQIKGFKRTIKNQGEVVDMSNEPPKKWICWHILNVMRYLILIWVGFFRCSFWGERGDVKLPRLKLVRIMLEISNLARTYIRVYSFRKYTFWYQGLLNFADVSIFCQKLAFFGQTSTFTQSNSMTAVFEIFYSGIRLPDCSKSAINWKNDNGVTVFWNDIIVNFFDVVLFLSFQV